MLFIGWAKFGWRLKNDRHLENPEQRPLKHEKCTYRCEYVNKRSGPFYFEKWPIGRSLTKIQ